MLGVDAQAWVSAGTVGRRPSHQWLKPFSIQIFKRMPGSDEKLEDGIDLLILKQDKKTRKIKGLGMGMKALAQHSGCSLPAAESQASQHN